MMRWGPSWIGSGLRRAAAGTFAGIAIVAGVWIVLWIFAGDRFLAVRWAAYAAPWIAILALVSALGAAAISRWLLAAALAFAAGIIFLPIMPRLNPLRWIAGERPAELRVLSYNASNWNDNYDAIAGMILRENADVILLQQVWDISLLRARLAERAPTRRFVSFPSSGSDTYILSRLPMTQERTFSNRTTALIAVASCRIRFWDLHAPHGHEEVGDQLRFFREAAEAIRAETSPLIVGGDLNSTEYNSAQAPLREQLNDAFTAAGFGFGLTFPSRVRRLGLFGRFVAIDHILYRGGPVPVWASVIGDYANSDHYPLLATFDLPPQCHAARRPSFGAAGRAAHNR